MKRLFVLNIVKQGQAPNSQFPLILEEVEENKRMNTGYFNLLKSGGLSKIWRLELLSHFCELLFHFYKRKRSISRKDY